MNKVETTSVSPHSSNALLSAVSCRLTKSAISKIINWSTSRYNVMKKPDVVNEIYNGMIEGGI